MQANTKILTEKQKDTGMHGIMFYPMLAVFFALFVLRNAFSVEFPVSVYLVWIAVMGCFFRDTEMKALLIAFIPLASGFQSKYAVLICMIFLLIRSFKGLKVPFFALIIPLLMLWEYLHLGEYSYIAQYLSGFAPLMCLFVVLALPEKYEDTAFFTRVLAISLAVGSLIMIYNTVNESGQSLLSLIQEGFRFGSVEEMETEDYVIVYNANGLGFLCNIAIAGLLTNIYLKKAKTIDYVFLIFTVFVGCLTISRTFLLCLAGTFVFYVFLQKKSLIKKAGTFFAVILILLVVLMILQSVAPGIIDNYVVRFNEDDVTGGRSDLFEFYNDFIFSTPKRLFIGIGMQNIPIKVWSMTGILMNSPHNGYQEMIISWGMIGLVLMLLFILQMVLFAQKKNPRVPIMCYLPLILLLTNIFAGQFITSGSKLLSLIFIYLIICNGGKEIGKE